MERHARSAAESTGAAIGEHGDHQVMVEDVTTCPPFTPGRSGQGRPTTPGGEKIIPD
jgi:hypothetical protein